MNHLNRIFIIVFVVLLSGCGEKQEVSDRDVSRSVVRTGKEVYGANCASCHGATGDGNGAAAVWLFPKPRNFSSGLFKIRSTPTGILPTDQDLFDTVTRGMPGSSMPSFRYLSEQERWEVVKHIKYLTAQVDESGNRSNYFEDAVKENRLPVAIQVPPEPAATVEVLTHGKQVFQKMQCARCHGETGGADGPSAATLKDQWDLPLPPRDFNAEAFRGGHTGNDLFLRIATGMAGTPMPAFGNDTMTDDERWALVHYIQSLRRKDVEINDMLAPPDNIIQAFRSSKTLPQTPVDPIWETIDPVRVPLNPLWSLTNPIPAAAVRVLYDGRSIAIHLQWRDPLLNGAPVRVQDFQDSTALQFSMNGTTPFLGMGDKSNPVNIWHWKAGWQQEFDGQRPDVDTTYASMHSDVYSETRSLYRTAEATGNEIAQPAHTSSVEDANAWGFGTLKSQERQFQNVKGKGVWRDGHWSVVFIRELKTSDPLDVKFSNGKLIPIAFAVWDGEQRDRNGRKVVSNWYHLKLEP